MLRKLDRDPDQIVMPRALASKLLRHIFENGKFPSWRNECADGNDSHWFQYTYEPVGDDTKTLGSDFINGWIEAFLERPVAAHQSTEEPPSAAG